MRPPDTEEGLRLARWQITEWFEWRNSGLLWSSETDFQSSIPFCGEDNYLRRVLNIEVPAEFKFPVVDYHALKERERLKNSKECDHEMLLDDSESGISDTSMTYFIVLVCKKCGQSEILGGAIMDWKQYQRYRSKGIPGAEAEEGEEYRVDDNLSDWRYSDNANSDDASRGGVNC